MEQLLTLKFKYSQAHMVVPRIVMWILAILAVVILLQRFLKCRREKTPFINFKGWRFFEKGYDKVKFYGTLVLLAGYFFALDTIGFLPASLTFVLLFNLLYNNPFNFAVIFGKEQGVAVRWKSLAASVVITVVASFGIYLLFGVAFNITLP